MCDDILKSMISVVIPTVQKKLKILNALVSVLAEDSSVNEILVINNKPEEKLTFSGSKVWVYTPKSNLYVNAAWNLGISLIRNDNFVLMNDDLIVCKDFCSKVVLSETFNAPNTGLIGYSPSYINNCGDTDMLALPVVAENEIPSFSEMKKYMGTQDWGITIFGKKENYYVIPEDLKIIYGDNYLLYQNLKNSKINYEIKRIPVNHIHSASSASSEFSAIVADDIRNSNKYFSNNAVSNTDATESNYSLSFNKNVCRVNLSIEGKKSTIFLKYRDENGVYPQEDLERQIFALSALNNSFVRKMVSEIRNKNTI